MVLAPGYQLSPPVGAAKKTGCDRCLRPDASVRTGRITHLPAGWLLAKAGQALQIAGPLALILQHLIDGQILSNQDL